MAEKDFLDEVVEERTAQSPEFPQLVERSHETQKRCPNCGCEWQNRGPEVDYNPETEPPPPPCRHPFHETQEQER